MPPPAPVQQSIEHPEVPGLYTLPGPSPTVTARILEALKQVRWQRSAGRSTYSCGWEWRNADGGGLAGWQSPPAALREALGLLELPAVNAARGVFNQVIFNHYFEPTAHCAKCHRELAPDCFSPSQNRKAAGAPKTCRDCVAASCLRNRPQPTAGRPTSMPRPGPGLTITPAGGKPSPPELKEGMPAHTDRRELGPVVWGITLSGRGYMAFTKRGRGAVLVPTNAGSAYYMSGESRRKWAHQPFGLDRLSITIRAVPRDHPKLAELGIGALQAEAQAAAKAAAGAKRQLKAIAKVEKKLAEIAKLKVTPRLELNQQAKVAREPELVEELARLRLQAAQPDQ